MMKQHLLNESMHFMPHNVETQEGKMLSLSGLLGMIRQLVARISEEQEPTLNGWAMWLKLNRITFLLLLASGLLPVFAQTPVTNLRVKQAISTQHPAVGDVVTYTMVVTNTAGYAQATGVRLSHTLPTGGASYVAGSATVLRGSGTYTATSGQWTLGTLAAGDSAVLTLKATVQSSGVFYNTLEVVASDLPDINSTPNNHVITEKDYDAICFSVPIRFVQGDEFTVKIPGNYGQITWYRNDQAVGMLSSSLATVNADSSLTIKSTGTYRFVTYINGCQAKSCCEIEVIPACATELSLTVSGDVSSCNGEVTSVTATATTSTAQIRWYLSPTGGTPFATTSSGSSLTVTPTATTTYYAEAFTADGCVSVRKPIIITVNNVPSPAVVGTIRNTCPSTTVNLVTVAIGNNATGVTYEWYTSSTRSQATRVTNLSAVGAGTYYVFAKLGTCYSSPAVVSVNIADCNCQSVAAVTISAGTTICAGGTVALGATLSGGATSVTWSSNGTGSFSSPASLTSVYTPSASDVALGMVTIVATTNDPDGTGVCQAATNAIMVKIAKRPDAPTGLAVDDAVVCRGNSTKLVGYTAGGKINWYDVNNTLIGTTVSGGKLVITPSIGGSGVYYAEAVNADGCTSASRTSVTVTVSNCLTDLGVQKQVITPSPYQVGQKITYSITATNLGAIAATNTRVTDVLPASLSYVSSTPVGQYSAAASTWTIGTLEAGGSRSLLIEATVLATGTVKNTAIISSPENDPTRTFNDTSSVTIQVGTCVVVAPTVVCAVTEICKGGTTTLSAKGCEDGTIVWSDGKKGMTILATPSSTTVYSASCVTGQCTSSSSNTILVTVLDPKSPTITASAEQVCPGTSVTLTAAGCEGGTIEWSDKAQSGTSIVVTPNGKTTYTAQCRLGSCLSSPTTKTIDITPDLPTPSIAASGTVVCPGETVTLTVNNCVGTPVWNTTTATTTSIAVTPTVNYNSYFVYCKNGACTSKTSAVYSVSIVEPTVPVVTASADAICSQGVVSLTATGCNGTVVWNIANKDGSPITGAVITFSPLNVNVSSYYAQCKVRSCVSAPSNSVVVKTLAASAPIIATTKTLVCSGEKITLSATGCQGGTINWYPINKTGATVDLYPTATTEYYATCKLGSCESEASNRVRVTVNTGSSPSPVVTASTTALCGSGPVSLTATGCAGGTVQWSDGQMGPVVSVSATPTNREFYALCKTDNQCGSGKSNVVSINIATSGLTAPTVVSSASSVCSGEKVTLTANGCLGTVQWYGVNQRGASVDVFPTSTQSYYVICTQNNCSSPVSNTVTVNTGSSPSPVISTATTAVCGSGLASLTATGCTGGTIQWSDGQTGSVVSVSVTATNREFYALCKMANQCGSGKSNVIAIPVNPATIPSPTVSASTSSICSGEKVILTATGCQGTVQWYGTNRTGNSIDLYPTATQTYYAICSQNGCSSPASNTVTVSVNTGSSPAPVVTASTTALCGNGLVSLTATGCNGGTVQWSDGQTGSVVSVSVTPTNKEFYAVCKVTNQCGSSRSNLISIGITPIVTPTVICSTDSICLGEQVKLTVQNCFGTPHWSTGETTTSITISPAVTTPYTVYCQDGTCKSNSSAVYTIKVIQVAAPTIAASATVVTPGNSITLTATGCIGEVIWSTNDVNGNNKGSAIVVRPVGTQTYYAQCKFRQCLSNPSTVVTVNPVGCIVNAGTLAPVSPTICAGTDQAVTLLVKPNGGLIQPSGYSLIYLLAKDGIVLKTSSSPSFTVAAANALYTVQTLVYDATVSSANYVDVSKIVLGVSTSADVQELIRGRCASIDPIGAKINVNRVDPPRLYGYPSLTVCQGTKITLGAIGCAGVVTWSDGSIGEKIEKTINSDLWLMATCTVNGCTSQPSNSVDVHLTNTAIPVIVSNRTTACIGETVSLTATGCGGGTYVWSDGKTVGNLLTLTPSADISYRVKCKIGDCEGDWSAYTTIKVGAPSPPTIAVSGVASSTVCFGTAVTLTAQGCSSDGYVAWSNNQVGNSITVAPTSSTTFTARCSTSNQCQSASSNVVTVTVLSKINQPVVRDLTNTCPMTTVDLSKAITSSASTSGGQFEYYSDAALSAKVTDLAHASSGTYYVVERTVNGCVSLPVAIHVQITTCSEPTPCTATNPATANAGADASVCAGKPYQLGGSMGGAGKTAHWTTSGSGTFDNSYALNAVYTASAEDVMASKVTLTLSVSTNNTNCPVAKDEMILAFNGIKTKPVIIVAGGLNLCYGDSVTLKAPAGAAGYLWSTGQTTQNIVVKVSGSYSVQLVDASGCSSVKSDNVVIKVSEPVMPPLVHDLRNTCPAKIVDLTKALSMTTVGSIYTYRICECNTSNIVIRPDSVCAGTYWVVEKSANGCVSAPAKIVVNIINCAADTMNADLSISKLASTAIVQNDAPVSYTLTVRNAGPYTARHIQVRDVLPRGLELVPNKSISYDVSNGVLSQRIDSLPVGQSKQIIYQAKIAKGQTVVNTAEIVYLDNKDVNLANNTSSVTVTDNTTGQPSKIGIAKAVIGSPTVTGDSLIRVSYRFVVSNYGADTLRKLQVADDLAYSFSPNKVMEAKVSLLTASSSLKVNPGFTGMGTTTIMLDSTSKLSPGKSEVLMLTATIKRIKGDTTRSFKNYAVASAYNSQTLVSDISTNGGDPDPDGDGNPANNTSAASFTLGAAQPQGASIGLALAVVKVESTPDSAYNVTYKAIVKNFGTVDLKGIVLTDSLVKVFAKPTSYTVVGSPIVRTGSALVANTGYDGKTQYNLLGSASSLAAGVQDSVLITVKVKTNGNNGPFYSSATVTGHTPDSTQTVMDVSNNGFDPTPAGSTSTTVRFDLPKGLLGVAKSVGNPVQVSNGVFDVPYTIVLTNMGSLPLKNVQIEDNLSNAFRHGALIVSNRVHTLGTGSIRLDSNYTGQGLLTHMLIDSASTLGVGMKSSVSFTVRVDVRNADSITFYNTAKATAVAMNGDKVEDVSTSGLNNDPDNDLDPRNNSQPTPIALNGLSTSSYLGLAMSVRDTTRQTNGSYNVTYQIVAKAYGPDALKNVSITDSLSQVFNTQTGSTFSLVNRPIITSTGSAIKLNPNFNGGSDPVLVLGDSTSMMAAGKADTILVVVNVASNGSTTTFLNSAYGQAVAKSGRVSDISTSGLNPDLNGNGNPTDSNEGEATALSLPPTYLSIFIPEGFSPNGDGVNDLFVIRGTAGLTVSLEVYNRWGHVVYQNSNYSNDWDGKPNIGITVNGNSNGVPDGTYYYVIKLSDGRKFVRYMTINR